jgi:hypothetical protein
VYRASARAHPGRYAAMQRTADLEGTDADRLVAAPRGYGPAGDDAVHAVRTVRAALHGFVLLETGDGFGIELDLDDSRDRLIGTLHRGLTV